MGFYKLSDYISTPFSRAEKALNAQDKSEKDLISHLKITKKQYNDYLSGKLDISEDFSEKLGVFFDINHDFFFKLQNKYDENKNIFDKEKKFYDHFSKKPFKKLIDFEIQNVDIMVNIFDNYKVNNINELDSKINSDVGIQARYRKSSKSNPYNLSAWLQYGENALDGIELNKFDIEGLKSFLNEKSNYNKYLLDYDNRFELFEEFKNKLLEFGVFLVNTPSIEKTPFGAVRWINGNPLVQVSDRSKSFDNFWFTILHELGHVVLHDGKDIADLDIESIEEEELQANRFATSRIFSSNYDDDIIKKIGICKEEANKLAEEYNVDISFIIGQFIRSDEYKRENFCYNIWMPKLRKKMIF